MIKTPQLNEVLICPICNKEFKVTLDTKYIVSGGYTCSWKCFLDEVKKKEKIKHDKMIERKK